jgi:hypothetical protein
VIPPVDFGSKGYKGVGYPTPTSIPEDTACTTINLPSDSTWSAIFGGLMLTLVDESAWQVFDGGISKAEAAARWLQIVDEMTDNTVCPVETETPFWDDESGDDADDEMVQDEQDWYGQWDGETFVESLAYWAVTAFLATGISEGAAIKFITPLRTFRLTLKKNPHGAKLLVLMDSNIFQLVDLFSASDQVAYVDIVSPGSTLMLVHSGEHNDDATPDANGNYTIDIIKGQLSETDVTPTNIRTDPDTHVFQTSPDNGTTWINNPESDPRTNSGYLLPPLTPYSGIECDVAVRMTAELHDTLDIFLASIDAAQFATGVLALLAFATGWVGWFADLFIFIGNALIDIGQSNIDDAFTDGVYDDIRCTFFCVIGSDGQVTQAKLDIAYNQIEAAHPGTVAGVIEVLRLFYGDVPMNNAGVVRTETGTCDDCPDCPVTCHQWTNIGSTSLDAIYTYRNFQSSLSPNVGFTKMVIEYTLNPNPGATLIDAQLRVDNGGDIRIVNLTATHDTFEFLYDGSASDHFNITVKSAYAGGSNYPDLNLVRFEYIPDPGISWSGGTDCP